MLARACEANKVARSIVVPSTHRLGTEQASLIALGTEQASLVVPMVLLGRGCLEDSTTVLCTHARQCGGPTEAWTCNGNMTVTSRLGIYATYKFVCSTTVDPSNITCAQWNALALCRHPNFTPFGRVCFYDPSNTSGTRPKIGA